MSARGGGEAGAGGRADAAALRERLRRSRAGLLEALGRLTEQDFASADGDGRSVLGLLADLAPAERADAARAIAGGGAGGAGAPPGPPAAARGALLAPQAIHDLAGARRGTLRALAALEEAGRSAAALEAIAEREERAAAAVRARSPARPPDGARRDGQPARRARGPRA